MARHPAGSVVLAAYRPDPVLFRRQLISIQNQTVDDFECVLAADGDVLAIRELVDEVVGSDPRFRVVGFDRRVGFHHNFERGLQASNSHTSWIALSDQDDLWYPNKLEILTPALRSNALVSGQARVVRFPDLVISANTGRRNVGVQEFILNNQFTGSLCVFRREVLNLALPFPSLATPTQVHDQWIALCAFFSGGVHVLDDVVQDYVQHNANVMGENNLDDTQIHASSAWRTIIASSRKYEGSTSPSALLSTVYRPVVGWREAMVEALATRLDRSNDPELTGLLAIFSEHRSLRRTYSFLREATASGLVPRRVVYEFTAGLVAGRLGGRRRSHRAVPQPIG